MCKKPTKERIVIVSKAGKGNYFRPRATLRLYLCFAGRISVKNANFKVKKFPFAGHMFPPLALKNPSFVSITCVTSYKIVCLSQSVNDYMPMPSLIMAFFLWIKIKHQLLQLKTGSKKDHH